MRIAVIGSGISGLSAAWLLSRAHDVTVFEQAGRPGGHVNTVDVATPGGTVPVDTGFIVYNETNYPNLTALFTHLGVPSHPTHMSFALSLGDGAYEYSGSGFGGFFGQWTNLARAGHWRLFGEILRFFRTAPGLAQSGLGAATLGEFLASQGYSRRFVDDHLLPMGAAIWSTSAERMLDYPAEAFLRFYENHGLLRMFQRPAWRTVMGGARTYVGRMIDESGMRLREASPIRRVTRHETAVTIEDHDGAQASFDQVVIGAHADEALAMLGDADGQERNVLGGFQYQPNTAVLHTDPSAMPRRRRLWSAWNYIKADNGPAPDLCVTYWMNALQSLDTRTDIFVTLNPSVPIDPARVHGVFHYDHPVFDLHAAAARARLWSLQGRRRTWFCGSYFGDGFHEDGIQSGLAVAEALGGVRRPWQVEGASARVGAHVPEFGMPLPEPAE